MESFFPVFFILIVVFGTIRRNQLLFRIKKTQKKRKENRKMDNSSLMRYKDKECVISANGYISGLVGKIIEISENWITVEDKKGKLTTFNCDYISSIKEK